MPLVCGVLPGVQAACEDGHVILAFGGGVLGCGSGTSCSRCAAAPPVGPQLPAAACCWTSCSSITAAAAAPYAPTAADAAAPMAAAFRSTPAGC